MSHYPVTGIQDGLAPGGQNPRQVPLRLEIDDLWASERPVHAHQRSLMIQAILFIQKQNPNDKDGRVSWYQIAGIHGQPFTPWDTDPEKVFNYCKHGEVTFSTWHRPYGTLMEQRLYEVMRDELIPQYPKEDRPTLLDAARQWRFPFWDWATKKEDADGNLDYNIPRLIRLHEVQVETPAGLKWVRNPFHVFRTPGRVAFGSASLGKWAIPLKPYSSCRATSRHPENNDRQNTTRKWTDGSQNNDAIMYEIQDSKWTGGGNLTAGLADQVFRTLKLEKFVEFSSTALQDDSSAATWMSLEGIHNNIHDFIGGGGQMGDPAVAAFDGIFWLHHANIDRLLAIWQAMHPKQAAEWFAKGEDSQDPLRPFRTKSGQYHTSSGIQKTNDLGYSYPDLDNWNPAYQTNGNFDPETYQAHVTNVVNNKYGTAQKAVRLARKTRTVPKAPALTVEALADEPTLLQLDVPKVTELLAQETGQQDPDTSDVFVDGVLEYPDYVLSLKYKRFGLEGEPFSIHVFIGDVPGNPPYNFSDTTTQVAKTYNFVSPLEQDSQKTGCENCARQGAAGHEVTDSKILTSALITRYKQKIRHSDAPEDYLHSMNAPDVAEFLKKHLHWRVVTNDNRVIPNGEEALGLKVAVAAGKARYYEDQTRMPDFVDYKILYEITEGSTSGSGATPADHLFPNPPFEGQP